MCFVGWVAVVRRSTNDSTIDDAFGTWPTGVETVVVGSRIGLADQIPADGRKSFIQLIRILLGHKLLVGLNH